MNFEEWFPVISFLFNILLLVWGVYELLENRKQKELNLREKERHQAQVKIWQHFANGLNHGLREISGGFAGDVSNVTVEARDVRALNHIAHALYQSLNEERLFTEEEVKQRQLEQQKEMEEMLKKPNIH